jgi:hypothetical protein
MRKVYVAVLVRLVINADEGVDIQNVLDEMDYSFSSNTREAEVEDMEIIDTNIVDSK